MGSPSSPPSVLRGVRQGADRLGREIRARLSHAAPGADPGGWLAVTALVDRGVVDAAGGVPGPLADLGDRIEVDVRPAPADKGTVIAARLVTSAESHDGRRPADGAAELQSRLREALRETKQLLETGQVMRVDPQPAGRRTRTLAGRAIDVAQAHGRDQGVL